MTDYDVTDIPKARISRPSCDYESNAHQLLSEVLLGRTALHEGQLYWWSGREWQHLTDEILEPITWRALMPGHSQLSIVRQTMTALRTIAPTRS